ncbi:MFS transporter [Actinomadura rupiterrae]|uniref:MFS transporter n=1 Tax=Actinomadura rupiterrae TaxID=559627 RepID=UPI0020A527DF|nr:MFS transporter [Actinomadura rupiterrae]MCP2341976.1 DHA1 family inner membrane transport protein [Actinomadura rupiterrae]
MPLALLALAISAFGIGTTEFVPNGLLPDLARDFHTSIPTAALLVSGYAFGVVVGAPLLTALGARLPRKGMLLTLMGLFIAGNLLSALAPTYGVLMAGRILAAFSHGAYFGVGAVVAADLVKPEKRAGAIALMFSGLTIANVLGVPAGAWLGQQFGWRATFWAISLIGVIALAGVAALVPKTARPEGGLRQELGAFRNPQVWLALGMAVLGWAPVFTVYTYISATMTDVAGFGEGAVPIVMILFGVGVFAGNLVGGRFADRALVPALYATIGATAAMTFLFLPAAHNKVTLVIGITVLGAAGFSTVAPLQLRVLNVAKGAPTLASAANIAAFNLGNTIGPFLAGLTIDAGFGYTSSSWVGGLLGIGGFLFVVASGLLERRTDSRNTTSTPIAADPAPADPQTQPA